MKKFVVLLLISFVSGVLVARSIILEPQEPYRVQVRYADGFIDSFETSDDVYTDGIFTDFPNPLTYPISVSGASVMIDDKTKSIYINLRIHKDAAQLSKEYHQYMKRGESRAKVRQALRDLVDEFDH